MEYQSCREDPRLVAKHFSCNRGTYQDTMQILQQKENLSKRMLRATAAHLPAP